jgi:hypothetical protein
VAPGLWVLLWVLGTAYDFAGKRDTPIHRTTPHRPHTPLDPPPSSLLPLSFFGASARDTNLKERKKEPTFVDLWCGVGVGVGDGGGSINNSEPGDCDCDTVWFGDIIMPAIKCI